VVAEKRTGAITGASQKPGIGLIVTNFGIAVRKPAIGRPNGEAGREGYEGR